MNTNSQNSRNNKKESADHRTDTRKHQYRNHDEVLTNDENYDPNTQKFKGEDSDFDDKMQNEDKNK